MSRVSLPASLREPSQPGSSNASNRRPLGDVTFNRKNASIPQRSSGLRQQQSADEPRQQPPKLTCRIPLAPLQIIDQENASDVDDDDDENENSDVSPVSPSTPGSEEFAPRTPDDDLDFDYAGLLEDDGDNGGDEAVNDMAIYAGLQGIHIHDDRKKDNKQEKNENENVSSSMRLSSSPTVSSIDTMESTPIPISPRTTVNENTNTFPLSASPPALVAASSPYPYVPSFQGNYTPQVLSLLNQGIAVMEQEVLHHLLGEDPESMLSDRKGGSSATRVLHLINFARKRVKNEVWLRMLATGDFSIESRYNALKGMVDGIRYQE